MKTSYIVIAHGSRAAEGNQAFFEFIKRFEKACPGRLIYGAFLELAKPSIPDAIDTAVKAGATQIIILPLMFFPGRHVKQDIPNYIQEAKEKYLEIDFHYSAPVAEHPMLLELLKSKVKDFE